MTEIHSRVMRAVWKRRSAIFVRLAKWVLRSNPDMKGILLLRAIKHTLSALPSMKIEEPLVLTTSHLAPSHDDSTLDVAAKESLHVDVEHGKYLQ